MVRTASAQCLLVVLHSGIVLRGAWEPYEVLGSNMSLQHITQIPCPFYNISGPSGLT